MTEEEQAALLAEGQAIADQQTLEALITGGETFADYAAALAELVELHITTEDAAQTWLDLVADAKGLEG